VVLKVISQQFLQDRDESEKNWEMMLGGMKRVVEELSRKGVTA
jgi:hypothetical protein